jgi:hypothetical protein
VYVSRAARWPHGSLDADRLQQRVAAAQPFSLITWLPGKVCPPARQLKREANRWLAIADERTLIGAIRGIRATTPDQQDEQGGSRDRAPSAQRRCTNSD